MYICSCHAVTDGKIKSLVQSGTKTFRALVRATKVGTQCGTCAKSAKEIFEQSLCAKSVDEPPCQKRARRLNQIQRRKRT